MGSRENTNRWNRNVDSLVFVGSLAVGSTFITPSGHLCKLVKHEVSMCQVNGIRDDLGLEATLSAKTGVLLVTPDEFIMTCKQNSQL
jgi:hypothetical protein